MVGGYHGCMVSKLKSRKLWATVIVSAITALAEQLGLPSEAVENLVNIGIAYLISQGGVDAISALKGGK